MRRRASDADRGRDDKKGTTDYDDKRAVQVLIDKILSVGVAGVGPIKGRSKSRAQQIADEHLIITAIRM